MLASLVNKLKNIVRFAQITGPADNNSQFPTQQMTYKGKVVNVLQVFPYGVYANVSSTDSLGIMFSIDGSENNRAAISYTPQKRPNDLAQNEVAIYHPQTESFIKFRNNGNLEIDSTQQGNSGDIIFNCNTMTVNAAADVDINATGNVTVDSASATVTTSGNATVDASGNVILNGTQIQNNGSAAGVVTTLSINPVTGTPFPDGSATVRAGDG